MVSSKFKLSTLQNFKKQLQELPNVIERANKEVNKEFLKLIDEGFEQERSPRGIKWRRKKRPNGFKTLQSRRNRLRNSIKTIRQNRHGFSIGTSVPYGKYHMTGTETMPARPFLPDGNELPGKYTRIAILIYRKHLARVFKK